MPPAKPVDTYKVPTRVTFSDTDSTSSDGSVNRCRYLSYFYIFKICLWLSRSILMSFCCKTEP
jgi:hypothetical protein